MMTMQIYDVTSDEEYHNPLDWFMRHYNPQLGDVVFVNTPGRGGVDGRTFFGIGDGTKVCQLYLGPSSSFDGPYVVPPHICAQIPDARAFFVRDRKFISGTKLFIVE